MMARKLGALMILAGGLFLAGYGVWTRDGDAILASLLAICGGFRLLYGFWPWDGEGWERR